MGELADEIKDLNNSVAYHTLEELQKDGSISKAEMDLYKEKYAKLHQFVLQTYENEQNFLARAKQLSQKLMAEKIKLEKTNLATQEDQSTIDQLTATMSEIQNEYELVQDREMMLQLQLAELEHEKREKEVMYDEKEKERQAELEPKIQKAKDENDNMAKEIENMRTQKDFYQTKLEEYNNRVKQVEHEIEQNQEIHKGHDQEHNKIKGDPDRIRKQAEKFESAVQALLRQQQEKKAEIEAATLQQKTLAQNQKEAEDQRSKAHLRLQMITESSKITDQSCEEVKKKIDREKNIYKELVTKRVALDQELDELSAESRNAQGDLSQLQKHFEKLKRQYRKTQMTKEGLEESLGPLQAQKKDMNKL